MLAIIGLAAGLLLGFIIDPTIPIWLQPYLPIMVVASIDTLLGALRAYLDHEFSDRAFIFSYMWNVLLASFIVFLGIQLGVAAQLTTAVIVVLGIRIFSNAAALRRYIFE